jgi:hypothetical protein
MEAADKVIIIITFVLLFDWLELQGEKTGSRQYREQPHGERKSAAFPLALKGYKQIDYCCSARKASISQGT